MICVHLIRLHYPRRFPLDFLTGGSVHIPLWSEGDSAQSAIRTGFHSAKAIAVVFMSFNEVERAIEEDV